MPDGQRHALRHGAARDRPVGRRAADQQGLHADRLRRAAARCWSAPGPGKGKGSITGLFTVLVDGDDHNEPIADAVRGILDGHIVLDRAIAERGRYPAVDILRSHLAHHAGLQQRGRERTGRRARGRLLAQYNDMAEMIRLGAYRRGSDPLVDEAIRYYPALEKFMAQSKDERCGLADGYAGLAAILGMPKP